MGEVVKGGKLAILVGIDGSGKTTLVNSLEDAGYFVSHWRRLKDSLPAVDVSKLNFINPAEKVQQLDGNERFDFIWGFVETEWRRVIKPCLIRNCDVVADGFWIRFLAKEMIYKRLDVRRFWDSSPLSGHELVLVLDTPPDIVLTRKKDISPYECFRNSDDFVQFQELQREKLLEIARNFNYQVIDGSQTKDAVLRRTLSLLDQNGFSSTRVS